MSIPPAPPAPPPNEEDAAHMRRALALARRGWGQTAPNPMVGAVLVRDGEVVGEGYHARYGGPHAEAAALAAAGERARGATAYVTLEPCAHHGKTPPCADALVAAGVRRVVCAVADPNPVARGGAAKLRDAGVEVAIGVEEAAARELNAPFFHAVSSDARPWITLKLAVSLDGAIAPAPGVDDRSVRGPRWLTGADARREVHRLRAGADAVAVGLGTLLADDPSLTVREWEAPRVAPTRVVFDRAARLPLASALARTARELPVVVLAEREGVSGAGGASRVAALRAAGVEVLVEDDLAGALRALRGRGVRSLLVEGGAGVSGELLGHDAVDRLIIFLAPLVLGAGALGAFSRVPPRSVTDAPRLRVVERQAFGDDLMTVYDLHPLSTASEPCSPDWSTTSASSSG